MGPPFGDRRTIGETKKVEVRARGIHRARLYRMIPASVWIQILRNSIFRF